MTKGPTKYLTTLRFKLLSITVNITTAMGNSPLTSPSAALSVSSVGGSGDITTLSSYSRGQWLTGTLPLTDPNWLPHNGRTTSVHMSSANRTRDGIIKARKKVDGVNILYHGDINDNFPVTTHRQRLWLQRRLQRGITNQSRYDDMSLCMDETTLEQLRTHDFIMPASAVTVNTSKPQNIPVPKSR